MFNFVFNYEYFNFTFINEYLNLTFINEYFNITLYTITAGTPPPAYQPHDDNSHNPHSQQTVNLQHGTRRPPPTPMDTMPSGGIFCKLINKKFLCFKV